MSWRSRWWSSKRGGDGHVQQPRKWLSPCRRIVAITGSIMFYCQMGKGIDHNLKYNDVNLCQIHKAQRVLALWHLNNFRLGRFYMIVLWGIVKGNSDCLVYVLRLIAVNLMMWLFWWYVMNWFIVYIYICNEACEIWICGIEMLFQIWYCFPNVLYVSALIENIPIIKF